MLFHHTCGTLDLIPSTRKEEDGEREKREGKERGEEKREKGWGKGREKERKASREMLGTSCPMSITYSQPLYHSQDTDKDIATMQNIFIMSCIFLSSLSRATPNPPHLLQPLLYHYENNVKTRCGVLVCNPNSQGTGRLLGVPGQPGPHSTILSYKHKTITTKRPL